jgi:hypothetical protein
MSKRLVSSNLIITCRCCSKVMGVLALGVILSSLPFNYLYESPPFSYLPRKSRRPRSFPSLSLIIFSTSNHAPTCIHLDLLLIHSFNAILLVSSRRSSSLPTHRHKIESTFDSSSQPLAAPRPLRKRISRCFQLPTGKKLFLELDPPTLPSSPLGP